MIIRLHRKFEKKFEKLPAGLQQKFFERVRLFQTHKLNPLLNDHSVDTVYPGWRSINITGDYRALFEEYGDEIVFMTIGTHSELYD